MLAAEARARLAAVLAGAAQQGLLGPAAVADHIEHALALGQVVTAALEGRQPQRVVDLGSGAGVPGLILAMAWPDAQICLLDSQVRRCRFLRAAVERLEVAGRVSVLEARAEVAGHDPAWRDQADVVVARLFGPAAVTAELGGPLLHVDGLLVVSEPPEPDPHRWPAEGLSQLGLALDAVTETPVRAAILRKTGPTPPNSPRRTGIPSKRPLW